MNSSSEEFFYMQAIRRAEVPVCGLGLTLTFHTTQILFCRLLLTVNSDLLHRTKHKLFTLKKYP